MARRIDIELTSDRGDGSWTWRAAGAKAPKGVVDAKVLYEGARVGDVVRAEADFNLDGIELVTVQPPKSRPTTPHVLEIKGSGRDDGPLVTSSLVPKSGRPSRDSREGRPPRREGEGRGGPRPDRGPAREGRPARADRPARPERPDRPERRDRPAPKAAPERPRIKRLTPANVHRKAVLDALSPDQRPFADHVLRGGIP
ncbi:MAG TPA: hypothetical protein VMY34_07440, partial [Acidimicrobiales bacterium]|nr:hypothetical protein [Acidimicrobiales bacterium]